MKTDITAKLMLTQPEVLVCAGVLIMDLRMQEYYAHKFDTIDAQLKTLHDKLLANKQNVEARLCYKCTTADNWTAATYAKAGLDTSFLQTVIEMKEMLQKSFMTGTEKSLFALQFAAVFEVLAELYELCTGSDIKDYIVVATVDSDGVQRVVDQ